MPTASAPPQTITAGDTIDFAWSSPDYPALAGWSTSWRIVGAGVPGLPLALTGTASGQGFIVTATAAETAAIAVPERGLQATLAGWASLAAQRFEVYRAPLKLLPNPAVNADFRGHAARVLAAIDALIEGRATKDQQSYRIGDRELARIPIPELLTLRDYYKHEAKREEDAAALASGMPRRNPRVILTRMARA